MVDGSGFERGVLKYLLEKISYKLKDEYDFFIFMGKHKDKENYKKWIESPKGQYHEGFMDGLNFCKKLVEEMLLLEKNINEE